jgi:bacillithiol system protein YtxJ
MMQSLTTTDEAAALIARPGLVWVFKHSATCGISAGAHDEVSEYFAAHPAEPCGIVIVQTHRPVSNWISTTLGITHQSPQVFLLRQGKILWKSSHGGITAMAMHTAATQATGAPGARPS